LALAWEEGTILQEQARQFSNYFAWLHIVGFVRFLGGQLGGGLEVGDLASLAYYRKVIREVPAPIWCRARGEALEERNIRKSRGALFAHLVKKHTGGLGNRSPAQSIKHKSLGLDD